MVKDVRVEWVSECPELQAHYSKKVGDIFWVTDTGYGYEDYSELEGRLRKWYAYPYVRELK